MTEVIISIDPSTDFLIEIIENFKKNGIEYNLTEIQANDESYQNTLDTISNFNTNSNVIFLGHGQSDQLYGGEMLDNYPKKPIVKLNEMGIFKAQNLFLLACDSSSLLKSSFRFSKTNKSIGFGGLPTSIEEIEDDRKLSSEGISEETIEKFKTAIVDVVSSSLSNYLLHETDDFIHLKDNLVLQIDEKINNAILVEKNRNLGDLLFKMRNEMVIY
jgi:hypothetical protein